MFILKDKINNKYLKFDSEKTTVFLEGKFNPTEVLVDSKEDATIFNLNIALPEVFYNLFENLSPLLFAPANVNENAEFHKFRAWFRYLSVIEVDKEFYVKTRKGIPYEESEDYKNTLDFENHFLSELKDHTVEDYSYDLYGIISAILGTASSLSNNSEFEQAKEKVTHAFEYAFNESCTDIGRAETKTFVYNATNKLPNQNEVQADGYIHKRNEFRAVGLYGTESFDLKKPSFFKPEAD